MTTSLSHSKFMVAARHHQREFLEQTWGISSVDPQRVHLPRALATIGANFVPLSVVRYTLRERYPTGWDGWIMPYTALYYDMLRSQHIPFNLFAPLKDFLHSDGLSAFFSELLEEPISDVYRVELEYAPPAAKAYMHDNTSFDAYIEMRTPNGKILGLGIEVKYTEGAYGWGDTEYHRMFNHASTYCQLSRDSGVYRTEALVELRSRRQKQIWRNQLLGEALLRTDHSVTDYRYILLYPAQSDYSAQLAADYRKLLSPGLGFTRFIPLTYERYLSLAANFVGVAQGVAWVEYAQRRYLLPTVQANPSGPKAPSDLST